MATTILVIGTAISALSAIQQGSYQRQVAQYNARVAENRKIALQQQADLDVKRHRERVKRVKASQQVAFLKSGVQLSGTPVDVITDTEARGLLDEKIIRFNAAQGIAAAETEAALSVAEGEQAFQSGLIDAGTSILSGAGKFIKRKSLLQ